jgi:hypothetical protein
LLESRHAPDNHPERHAAGADRHDRHGDDHGPGGGRDAQRQQRQPGVPD